MIYQLYQQHVEDIVAWLWNDYLSHDPDKTQICNITVCITGWLNEADADAQEQLLNPHNETSANEAFNKLVPASVSCGSDLATSDSENRTQMQHTKRRLDLMAKAEG